MTTEAEADRRDQLIARVGDLHALVDTLPRTDDDLEFSRTLLQIEDLVQKIRELSPGATHAG